jgi:hypothetical protein
MSGYRSKKAMANMDRIVPLDDPEFIKFVEKRNYPMSGVKKEIRNGLVAVLYSPGYGAGWSTWNTMRGEILGDELLFDPSIVYMVEEMEKADDASRSSWVDNIVAYCEKKYPDGYFGGAGDLTIEWIPEGTQFRIDEYDGSESIMYKENDYWITA